MRQREAAVPVKLLTVRSLKIEMGTPLRPDTVEFVFHESDSASSFGIWSNLLLVYGDGPPRAPNVSLFDASVRKLTERHPSGAAVLVVVQPNSTPTSDGRDALIAMFKAHRRTVSFAFVLESSGFATAAQRAMLSAILFVTPYRDRIHVAGSLESGLHWLATRTENKGPQPWKLPSIQAAVREFCAQQSAQRKSA